PRTPHWIAVRHAAETDAGDGEPGAAESRVLHCARGEAFGDGCRGEKYPLRGRSRALRISLEENDRPDRSRRLARRSTRVELAEGRDAAEPRFIGQFRGNEWVENKFGAFGQRSRCRQSALQR